jgi:hypothetical protein
MTDLYNFQSDVNGDDLARAEELMKAMEAGLGTGRDYNDTIHNGPGLKTESLDAVTKVLAQRMEHLVFHQSMPKQRIYNTVHEYNQLFKYGEDVGIFNAEGETPAFTDSQYRRKSAVTKFTGVGGQVTHPAMLAKYADGKNALQREVENKTILLMTLLNQKTVNANSSKGDKEFDGVFRLHELGLADIVGGATGMSSEALLDTYFNDVAVIDADGAILKDKLIENSMQAIVNDRFGMADRIIAPPSVWSAYVTQYHESKRFIPGLSGAIIGATTGQSVNDVQTQFGKLPIKSDIFFDYRKPKKYNAVATSDKAPAKPVKDGSTPNAVNTDTKTKFTNHAGTYFYGVTAKNRYGESAIEPINTTGQAVTATQSVDIKFAAGSGAYAAESFVIYRTEADPASYQTADYHPMFEVSVAELAAGWDGGAVTLVRDRNRFIAGTHSALVYENSPEVIEYLEFGPTQKMDLAITSPSRRFLVLNYGCPVLYQPGKVSRIVNIKGSKTN